MKVDLSVRDIELILSLLSDSGPDELGMAPSLVYSFEEVALLEKLETALKKCDLAEKDILDTGSSGFCH